MGFCIVWGIVNFDKLKVAISGTSLYTQEDLDNSYRDGYDTAVSDKEDLLSQIQSLRSELDTKKTELAVLESKYADYDELSSERNEFKLKIASLEKEIADLNASIEKYKEFVSSVEEYGKVVATFMFDGAVYDVQSYNVGDTVSVTTPASTDYVEFLGWTLNGNDIDLTNYVINDSVTFVAKVSSSYSVMFMSADRVDVLKSQIVKRGSCPSAPEVAVDYGYTFKGWNDGVNVYEDVSDVIITKNTVFSAVIELLEVDIKFTFQAGIMGYNYEFLTDIDFDVEYIAEGSALNKKSGYAFYYVYGGSSSERILLSDLDKTGMLGLSKDSIIKMQANGVISQDAEKTVTFYLVDPLG